MQDHVGQMIAAWVKPRESIVYAEGKHCQRIVVPYHICGKDGFCIFQRKIFYKRVFQDILVVVPVCEVIIQNAVKANDRHDHDDQCGTNKTVEDIVTDIQSAGRSHNVF